jgi:hypothetical protein
MNKIDESFIAWKHWNKHKQFNKAFKYLEKGNRLRDNLVSNRDIREDKLIKRLRETFPISIPTYKKSPFTPIFIVGMPRSGTSLIEQIISNHSQVAAKGELPYLEKEIMSLQSGNLTDKELNNIRVNYFNSVDVDGGYVTDKMPLNFRWVGFIKTCFPEAKIIHCQKDAMSVCWSIYKQNWLENGNEFSYDLVKLGEFYNQQKEIMNFWKAIYPNSIFTANHKELTNNSNKTINKLFEYLGIDIEDDCLKPHLNKNKMVTASKGQVKSPIYKKKCDTWLNYKEHLKPLVEVVGV